MARLVDSDMPGNADSGFRRPTNRTSAQNDESGYAHAGTSDEALLWKATQEVRSGPANATRQALVTSCTDAAIKDDRKNPGRGRGIRTPDIQLPKLALYQTELYPDGPQANDTAADRQWYVRPIARVNAPSSHDQVPETKKPTGISVGFSLNGAPGEIRTPDHQVRSLVLYPAELRAHWNIKRAANYPLSQQTRQRLNGGERGIRTLDQAFDPILP
jgi:hypothetical protein